MAFKLVYAIGHMIFHQVMAHFLKVLPLITFSSFEYQQHLLTIQDWI